jgi:hypothetical protein
MSIWILKVLSIADDYQRRRYAHSLTGSNERLIRVCASV